MFKWLQHILSPKKKSSFDEWADLSLDKLHEIYDKTPTSFEYFVEWLFQQRGYATYVTQASSDGGKDLLVTKDSKLYVVEVKLYSNSNTVGRPLIQKLQGAMLDCHAQGAIFVTTGMFTTQALCYAQRNGVEAIDGFTLMHLVREVRNNAIGTQPKKLPRGYRSTR